MSAADVLSQVLHEFELMRNRLNKLVEPWDDAKLAEQPHGQVNHPAWTIGHLCSVLDNGCMLAGGRNELDESLIKACGGGSIPTTDRSAYPSKAKLLETYNATAQRLVALLQTLDAAKLTAENVRANARPRFPQTGHLLVHMITAEQGYHLGQLTGWCRAMGWPVKF